MPVDAFVGWALPDAVEPVRCTELIEMLVTRGFEPTGARYPGDYRNNDRLVFDDAVLAAWLFERTRERLPAELVIDGERWLLDGLNPRFRACRYAGGQAFCIHRDGPYAPDPALRSHLTLQLYLDEDPARAGGHTRFYADPRGETLWASIAPRTGTAIVFDHRAWHDGEAVTGGIKHVLRTDVIYRRVATVASTSGIPTGVAKDDRVLYQHRGYAWQAIVCRDGAIASAGRDGTVHVRRDGATSADASLALGAGRDGTVHVRRDGATSVDATLALGAGSVTRLVEAHDGRLWCGTRAGAIFVIEGLRATMVARELGAILDLAARPGGGIVAATALGELVALERNGSIAWRIRAHDGWAWAVVADGNGSGTSDAWISAGHDGWIRRIGGPASEDLVPIVKLPASIRALALDHIDARADIIAGDTAGTLYRITREGEVTAAWAAHRGAITGVIVLPDRRIVSGSEDGCVHVWSDEDCVTTFSAGDFITSVAHDSRGQIVCASYDGKIYRAPLAISCRPTRDDVLARSPAC